MQFLRRNRWFLLTLAVLFLSSILVVNQYLSNQSAHTRQVEDFLLLHEMDEKAPFEHLYQVLVQQLPHISDHLLVQDLQRTAMALDTSKDANEQMDDLIWKYHVSVNNELKRRSRIRVQTLLKEYGK